jgi:uncharacterized protein (UPF0276 family)
MEGSPARGNIASARLEGCGVGLRREHYGIVLRERPKVPWFEVISENFMVPGGRPRHVLEAVRRDYPVALHGVSLSVGSAEPLDRAYVRALKTLVDWVEPTIVSDHLCFTALAGHNSHDLLPLPFTEEAVETAAQKIRQVQDILGRRILVENVSTYLRYRHGTMTEWEFVSAVAEQAGCGLLLDVNNVHVNSVNHGFDPSAYLEGIPEGLVGQYHLAGHEDHGDHLIDTHDHPVPEPVWSLFAFALRRFGPKPALIEWDALIPELPALLGEAQRADSLMEDARVRQVA